jgi:hypothetical protein
MRRYLFVATFAVMLLFGTAGVASADPITCPPGQHSDKIDGVWQCVNNGGSGDPQTEDPRNPNMRMPGLILADDGSGCRVDGQRDDWARVS